MLNVYSSASSFSYRFQDYGFVLEGERDNHHTIFASIDREVAFFGGQTVQQDENVRLHSSVRIDYIPNSLDNTLFIARMNVEKNTDLLSLTQLFFKGSHVRDKTDLLLVRRTPFLVDFRCIGLTGTDEARRVEIIGGKGNLGLLCSFHDFNLRIVKFINEMVEGFDIVVLIVE